MTEETLIKTKKKIKISNLHEIGLLIALILVLLLFSLTTENFTVHPNNLDNNGNFVGPQKNYYPNYCIVNYIIRAK